MFGGKTVLITGGTGSIGHAVVARLLLLSDQPNGIIVFSRDEAKQHQMRLDYPAQILTFCVGDIRDYAAVQRVVRRADVIIHAAAMKQVPTCEANPFEAVQTNVHGAANIIRAVADASVDGHRRVVVGISTDKACKPVNVMGMTKAILERLFVAANGSSGATFVCVRYGNVIASRGSVVPLFVRQIRYGRSLTLTTPEMTRFLLSSDTAVDAIFAAVQHANPGEIFVPCVRSARVRDVATMLMELLGKKTSIDVVGIRPGEKIHEILVSEEEIGRTVIGRTVYRDGYYVIIPPNQIAHQNILKCEYSSSRPLLSDSELRELLEPYVHSSREF